MEKLDNPVWHSLSEVHKNIAIAYSHAKFYEPDHCPFGAFDGDENISSDIDEYAKLIDNCFIVGKKPLFSQKMILQNELECLQMVIEEKIDLEPDEPIIRLNKEFDQPLYDLINLVQPGYFKKNTVRMGDYCGIFQGDKLVAASGERMKMQDFTEVSAVVTHPLYRGRGYAGQLVAHSVNKIFDQNKTPYLHVARTNTGAIILYEKLGFRTRRKISFWNLSRVENSIHLGA